MDQKQKAPRVARLLRLFGLFLVKHLGAKVGECRPGNQYGRDKSKNSENAHNCDGVTGFDIIDDIGCAFHDVSPGETLFSESVGC